VYIRTESKLSAVKILASKFLVSMEIMMNKKAVLSQGNRAMKQLLFWFTVRRQHSLFMFKSSQAPKARLQSSKRAGAKQFNAKWPF